MIIAETHPSEAMKLAAQVAASVVLVQIHPRLVRLESRLKAAFPEVNTQFKAAFKQNVGKFDLREADKLLDVHVGAEIRFFAEKEDIERNPDNWSAEIELDFVLTYRLPPAPIPTEVKEYGLAAFSRVNARLACWPYIRHQVNHLASELGIPFVMPTLLLESGDRTRPKASAGSNRPGKTGQAGKVKRAKGSARTV
jgi:hypothetical protein